MNAARRGMLTNFWPSPRAMVLPRLIGKPRAHSWMTRISRAPCKVPSTSRHRGKIPFLQNLAMVPLVPGKNIRQGTHTDLLLIGHAPPQPCCRIERVQQRNAGSPHRREFFQKFHQGPRREIPGFYLIILLEASERRLVCARNAQHAVSKDTLRIADVSEHFLDGPFSFRVTELGTRLAQTSQQ